MKAVNVAMNRRERARAQLRRPRLRVKQHGAILGMQMQRNIAVIPGRCAASNPDSRFRVWFGGECTGMTPPLTLS